MAEHSPEPWVIGGWEERREGRKLFYVFTDEPSDIFTETAVYSGVAPGAKVHCSERKRPGHCVMGLEYDYSDSYMILSDEDRRRLVACVNFCAGLSTEWLEEHEQLGLRKDCTGIVLCAERRDE